MNEKNKKNIGSIITDVLLFLVVIIALFVLIITISSKKDSDGTATLFGYQLRFVQSDSMDKSDSTDVSEYEIKSIPIKSCIFIKVLPSEQTKKEEIYKTFKVGDVLTIKYVYTKQETITHRIVEIKEKPTGGYLISLEGDNKSAQSGALHQVIDTSEVDSPNYIVGKVVGKSYLLGLLVYAFKNSIGIIFLVIVPCLIIIIFEIMRIVRVLNLNKKDTLQQQQANEIEELKRQIAMLQKDNKSNEDIEEGNE